MTDFFAYFWRKIVYLCFTELMHLKAKVYSWLTVMEQETLSIQLYLLKKRMHSKWAANRLQHPHCSTWWVCNHRRPKVSKTDLCCLVARTVQWLCNNYFNVVWCNEAINCGFMAQVANFSAAWYIKHRFAMTIISITWPFGMKKGWHFQCPS